MTVATFALGRPLPAPQRGGDCRGFDLRIGRKVLGSHRFLSPEDCQLRNGLLRVGVSATGTTPGLTIEARRGAVVIGDTYSDVYSDTYGGSLTSPEWISIGVLTIDAPSVAAVITGVRMVAVSDEAVIVRLVAPAIGDAFVTLERGMPFVTVQHGDSRQAVDIDRRVSLSGDGLVGSAAVVGRVQEDAPAITGMYRWIGAVDAVSVDAGAFSLTEASVTVAVFGAGVATADVLDTAASQHAQLGDASIPLIAIEESE